MTDKVYNRLLKIECLALILISVAFIIAVYKIYCNGFNIGVDRATYSIEVNVSGDNLRGVRVNRDTTGITITNRDRDDVDDEFDGYIDEIDNNNNNNKGNLNIGGIQVDREFDGYIYINLNRSDIDDNLVE